MANIITICIAAFLRGLAAHGLSFPFEATVAAFVTLPPLAGTLIGLFAACLVVEGAAVLVEHLLRKHRAASQDRARRDGSK